MLLNHPWRSFSKQAFDLYDNSSSQVEITSIALCDIDDIIAIAFNNGRVGFFNSSGERHDTWTDVISKESFYNKLVWVPQSKSLLIGGRADGTVTSWGKDKGNDDEGARQEQNNKKYNIGTNADAHSCGIIQLLWSNNDNTKSRLVSIDTGGMCCIWKIDHDNNLVGTMQFDTKMNITCAISLSPYQLEFNETSAFLLGSNNGRISYHDEKGQSQIIVDPHSLQNSCEYNGENNDDQIAYIFCEEPTKSILAMTRSNTIIQFYMQQDGSMVIRSNFQLDIQMHIRMHLHQNDGDDARGDGEILKDLIMTSRGQLVALSLSGVVISWFPTSTNDGISATSGSYVLDENSDSNSRNTDRVLSMNYSQTLDVLAVGTEDGNCVFWKERDFNRSSLQKEESNTNQVHWSNVYSCNLSEYDAGIRSINFGHSALVETTGTVMIALKQEVLLATHGGGKAAMQIDEGDALLFHDFDEKPVTFLQTYSTIVGMSFSSRYLCLWTACSVQVYDFFGVNQCEIYSEISIVARTLAIDDESIYIVQEQSPRSLLVTDLYGVKRLSIRFPEHQGCPQYLNISNANLVVVTDVGTIKVMNIEKKEPQQHICHENNMVKDAGLIIDHVEAIKVNADCSVISVLSRGVTNGATKEESCLSFFSLKTCKIRKCELLDSSIKISSHYWDLSEPKLFICEGRKEESILPSIFIMFVSPDDGKTFLHCESKTDSWPSVLIGLHAPFYFTLSKPVTMDPSCICRIKVEITGFNSIGEDPSSISAFVNCSYYLATGDIDLALVCAEPFDFEEIWMKMARASFRPFKRIDIAKLCRSKLGHTEDETPLRYNDVEVSLAVVAIQLGMFDEAEYLYRDCQRMDLLCDLYRTQGLWDRAFEVAEGSELLVNSLHYHYGAYLEDHGHIESSLSHYEKSSMPKLKLLEKFLQFGCPVEAFLKRTNDEKLMKHYALCVENQGNISLAKELYSLANDHLGLVTLACREGDFKRGCKIAIDNQSKAGFFHLGLHLESKGDIKGALRFLSMSGMYRYAIHLALENDGFDHELFDLAMKVCVDLSLVAHCAQYFFNKGQQEAANRLFSKAGVVNSCPQNRSHDEADEKHVIDLKLLTKQGDVDAVVAFANKTKSSEVYMLAANYLETIDGNNESIAKKWTLDFYTKAKSFVNLVRLLRSWSKNEALEGDYERAMTWLNEAKKNALKLETGEDLVIEIEAKLDVLKLYLRANDLSDPPEVVNDIISRIIGEDNGSTIQLVDCYAVLLQVEKNKSRFFDVMVNMRDLGIDPIDYVEESTVASICSALGKDRNVLKPRRNKDN